MIKKIVKIVKKEIEEIIDNFKKKVGKEDGINPPEKPKK